MDLFSPRPEHTQLDKDTINPKNKQFPKEIPSNSFNAITLTINKTDPSTESNGLGFLQPPLPLHTSSINSPNLDIISKVSNTVNLPASSLTNIQENAGFPSPPQSPKLSHIKTKKFDNINTAPSISDVNERNSKDVMRLDLDKNIFLVRPNWGPELSISKYKRSTRRFLSHYRIFKDKDKNKESANILPFQKECKHSLRSNRYRGVNKDTNHYYDSSIASQRLIPISKHTTVFSNINEPNILKQRKKAITKNYVRNTPKRVTIYSNNHTTPNINWELLPDYSPSWDTLPTTNINNSMRVEWKGSMMDLSNDPLKDKLHPAELNLAQILRLPCSLYLDSKRRLFMSKVERMQEGLPFRRTDAQKACHIDVNKASRLYSAYEKVGWLDDKLFTKYL